MAKKLAYDRVLFGTVALAVGFGLVMVYSASAGLARADAEGGLELNPYVAKQVLAAVLGLAAMALAMHVDYRHLRRPAVVYALVAGAVALLVLVLYGPEINGTHRWFRLGPLSVQPSELAKLALVPFVAYQIEKKPERVNQPAVLAPVLVATGTIVGLVLLQPDFGTAVLLLVAVLLVLFLAGLAWRFLVTGAMVTLPLLALLVLSAEYRRRRLFAFLDPESDPLGASFQAHQSLIAVGSGGLLGLGPGGSVQKLNYLPHPHSDYVFAIAAEELGLLGAAAVLALFAVILWRGVRAGAGAPDLFGRYLAWGLTGVLVIQALIHVSVCLALAPSKGIPLPFISYGGSSLVVSMVACGILLNVSEHG
ncbi:MAG TPA: putative lipid II flippase FtsW [Thermoanaerobaculia bacterium]|nr:putative lipid II flippase FtsW [Thermoanaerobaculia bacterium]